jgi:hypothetical protein
VLDQLPALIGVMIGALGSYLAIAFGDRARFRREQVATWRVQRQSAYADYARALKSTLNLTYRVAAHLGLGPHPYPLPWTEAAARFDAALEVRDVAWESMQLIGTTRVLEAATAWFRTTLAMERFVRNGSQDAADWQTLMDDQHDKRERFYAAARTDLGVPGTAPATPSAK